MNLYQDTNGIQVDVFQLVGPSIINTINGEKVGEDGQYLIFLPNSKPEILTQEVFNASFTKVG